MSIIHLHAHFSSCTRSLIGGQWLILMLVVLCCRHQLHWVLEDMLRRTPLLPYLQQLEKLSLEKHHQEQRKWAKRPIRELSE